MACSPACCCSPLLLELKGRGAEMASSRRGSRRTFLEDLGTVDLDQTEVRILVFLAVAHGGRDGGSVM